MKTTMSITPASDSHESCPDGVSFTYYKAFGTTNVQIGSRRLEFDADSLLSIFKTFDVIKSIK